MRIVTRHIITAGLLLAAGVVLPAVFHTLALGGTVLLPMHLPVLLAGFLLSPLSAFIVGALLPLLNSIITGMPPLFPVAAQMSCELAAYGIVASLCYSRFRLNVYICLFISMLSGRIVNAVVTWLLYIFIIDKAFNISAFLTAAFVTALPGIILQFLLIPALVRLLNNSGVQHKEKQHESAK